MTQRDLFASHRVCRLCNNLKPLTDFIPRASSPTGVGSYCRLCFADYQRKRNEGKKAARKAWLASLSPEEYIRVTGHKITPKTQVRGNKRLDAHGMWRCARCELHKPKNAFALKHNRPRSWCKECQNKYHAEWRSTNQDWRNFIRHRERDRAGPEVKEKRRRGNTERRMRYLRWYAEQKSGPCSDCGRCFPRVCMQFDHRDGETKTIEISRAVSKGLSIDFISSEIAKCDLVCSNCHHIREEIRRHIAGGSRYSARLQATPETVGVS